MGSFAHLHQYGDAVRRLLIVLRHHLSRFLFTRWSAALPSILGSRLMLNMREVVRSQTGSGSYMLESYGPSQTLEFRDQEASVSRPGDGECD